MWKTGLCCNVLILLLFWILGQIAITPIENLMIRYAETGVDLPILTDFAIQMDMPSLAIPLLWAILTVVFARRISDQASETRQAWLSLHISMTLCLGLITLIFFSLAATLPVLKIGSALN